MHRQKWEKIDGEWFIVNRNPYNLAKFEIVEKLQFHYSPTGESHGCGSEPYRWVSQLTPTERELVKAGHVVIIDKYVSSNAPQPIQLVVYAHGRYNHRVPEQDMLNECLQVAGYEVP